MICGYVNPSLGPAKGLEMALEVAGQATLPSLIAYNISSHF